jgi:hypothetical protein
MYSPQTLRLLDPRSSCPPAQLPFARAFLAGCTFVFAKSVPKNPHSYLVRDRVKPELQADYRRFTGLIKKYGYKGRFLRVVYTYLDVDEYRYWESPTLDRTGMILNRALNADDQDCCRLASATGGKHHAKDCAHHKTGE